MIKYTRSIQKLSDCIKDIFDTTGISTDTKALLLVLAATMSISKFNKFIDSIDKLSPIAVRLKEVNNLRFQYGDLYRDFIIVDTLHSINHEVNSDELQQFISEGKEPNQDEELSPALSREKLQPVVDKQSFSSAIHRATEFLVKKLGIDHKNNIHTITDAYLDCRGKEPPVTAYYAIIYAMAEILEASGLDPKNSLLYSNKLADHALNQFISTDAKNNRMLNVYSAITNNNS